MLSLQVGSYYPLVAEVNMYHLISTSYCNSHIFSRAKVYVPPSSFKHSAFIMCVYSTLSKSLGGLYILVRLFTLLVSRCLARSSTDIFAVSSRNLFRIDPLSEMSSIKLADVMYSQMFSSFSSDG